MAGGGAGNIVRDAGGRPNAVRGLAQLNSRARGARPRGRGRGRDNARRGAVDGELTRTIEDGSGTGVDGAGMGGHG